MTGSRQHRHAAGYLPNRNLDDTPALVIGEKVALARHPKGE